MALISSILKTEDWSFEKEWRFVSLEKVKSKNDSYIDLEISAIYFGEKTPKSIKNMIKKILQKMGKEIPLYEMKKKLTGLEYRKYDYFCECKDEQMIQKEEDGHGYWKVCCNCRKPIEDSYHYYNHYDGEDHDEDGLDIMSIR